MQMIDVARNAADGESVNQGARHLNQCDPARHLFANKCCKFLGEPSTLDEPITGSLAAISGDASAYRISPLG